MPKVAVVVVTLGALGGSLACGGGDGNGVEVEPRGYVDSPLQDVIPDAEIGYPDYRIASGSGPQDVTAAALFTPDPHDRPEAVLAEGWFDGYAATYFDDGPVAEAAASIIHIDVVEFRSAESASYFAEAIIEDFDAGEPIFRDHWRVLRSNRWDSHALPAGWSGMTVEVGDEVAGVPRTISMAVSSRNQFLALVWFSDHVSRESDLIQIALTVDQRLEELMVAQDARQVTLPT